MAVIWQKTVSGKNYEVRSAGQTKRLYTDGVFHSQYNPRNTLTANVWDLISLPGFFLEAEQVRRVLVLGVGGGAVIRQFRSWFPAAYITGIELDRIHLYVARRFFGLKDSHIELVEADALEWVKQYRGLPFDIVIDDLFAEQDGEPERVVAADRQWIKSLLRLLTRQGMLVMNFISSKELRSSACFIDEQLTSKFTQIYRLMTPLYENNIGVFLQHKSSTNEWRRRILQNDVLRKEFTEKQAKYQVRKLVG
jgi:spermidine synthase